MTPVDPSDAANAVHTAGDYIAVYERLWPVAVTGGVMGVFIHGKEICASHSRLAAFFLATTEMAVGASAAMVLATLMPSIVGLLPDGVNLTTPEAKLGLCGFIGGTFGRRVFRWIWEKLFRDSGERGKK